MNLKAYLAATAVAALAFAGGAHARIAPQAGGDPAAQTAGAPSDASGYHRRGEGRGHERHGHGFQPPPPPPVPGAHPHRYGPGYEGRRHGHDWGRHRDRDRRRDRIRDGAAVVLGLGVLGALASRPRYDEPYYGYDAYPPPPPPPPPQPYGYDPAPGYDDRYAGEPYDVPSPYAGGYGQPGGAGVVRCSSNEYRTTWCALPQGARATIRRKLSSASCDYGRDWGVAPNAIWVANGCRAEFSLF